MRWWLEFGLCHLRPGGIVRGACVWVPRLMIWRPNPSLAVGAPLVLGREGCGSKAAEDVVNQQGWPMAVYRNPEPWKGIEPAKKYAH